MPTFVHKHLVKYDVPKPRTKQNTPYEPNLLKYGREADEIAHETECPSVGEADEKYIQRVV